MLIGAAVDVVVMQEDSVLAQFGIQSVMGQLWLLGLLTFVIWSFESLFEYLFGVMWRNLAQTIQHELRLDAYGHIQQLEMAYFEDRSTGGMMSILSDDINQLERFLDGGANDILQVTTTTIVVTLAFFWFSPAVAVLAMLPIPFVLWGSLAFQKRIAPRYSVVREKVANINGQLANNIGGVATIKSFTAEAFEVARIQKESEAYRESNRNAIRLSAAFSPLIRIVILTGFIATLVYGGHEVLYDRLSPGTYTVMVFLTQRLLWPFTRLGSTFDQYQRAMASTDRVMDLLDTEPAIRSGSTSLPVNEVRGDVEFDKVTFSYHERVPVLDQISLRAKAGDTIAIVGATGSGKSTIIKLLLRFYEGGALGCEETGSVRIDGHDIRTLDLQDLRRAIAIVSQDVFLFYGTVRDNIAYGLNAENPSDEKIVWAAKLAEAHDFILQLPDGYDTWVGERGQKLSDGQCQRVAMARAILKDAPILVLDEATSAVDNETEAAMQRSLEHVAVDRTTIVIAHRLSTVRHADCIYVLADGAVKEQGTHEALLEQSNGIYTNLWKVQTGEAVELI